MPLIQIVLFFALITAVVLPPILSLVLYHQGCRTTIGAQNYFICSGLMVLLWMLIMLATPMVLRTLSAH